MIFDFKCPASHVFEANVSSDTHSLPCKECPALALRIISAPFIKLSPTGDFPGAALKWAKEHERRAVPKSKD